MFSKFIKKNKNYLDSRDKHDLLHNVYILYIIFVIAVADIFYILQVKDYYSAFIFISVGILISYFSKNMVVILCIAIIVTHLMKYGSKWKEGFDDNTSMDTNPADITIDDSEKMVNELEKEVDQLIDGDKLTEEEIENKVKKMKEIEHKTKPENINKLLEKQQLILDKLEKYKPLLNTIQSISTNLGLSTTAPPSTN
jgi:hypothetical protein